MQATETTAASLQLNGLHLTKCRRKSCGASGPRTLVAMSDIATPTDLAGLVPLRDAMRIIGLPTTLSTCLRWARSGTIPATRIGRRWYIRPADLRSAAVGSP